jgi:hypothetical protein
MWRIIDNLIEHHAGSIFGQIQTSTLLFQAFPPTLAANRSKAPFVRQGI